MAPRLVKRPSHFKALHEGCSLRGSLQDLPPPRLSNRMACSRALYRASPLRGSPTPRGLESFNFTSPMTPKMPTPTTPAPPRLAPGFSTRLAHYEVCSLQGSAPYKATRLHEAPLSTRLPTPRCSLRGCQHRGDYCKVVYPEVPTLRCRRRCANFMVCFARGPLLRGIYSKGPTPKCPPRGAYSRDTYSKVPTQRYPKRLPTPGYLL